MLFTQCPSGQVSMFDEPGLRDFPLGVPPEMDTGHLNPFLALVPQNYRGPIGQLFHEAARQGADGPQGLLEGVREALREALRGPSVKTAYRDALIIALAALDREAVGAASLAEVALSRLDETPLERRALAGAAACVHARRNDGGAHGR